MKKTIKNAFKIVGVSMLLLFIIVSKFPVKMAVDINRFKSNDSYIIIKSYEVTGYLWVIIGNNKGMLKNNEIKPVSITGKIPAKGYNYEFECGQNSYLCYADKKGQILTVDGEYIDEYEVYDWYPVYPIIRQSIFPFWIMSPKYTNLLDLW